MKTSFVLHSYPIQCVSHPSRIRCHYHMANNMYQDSMIFLAHVNIFMTPTCSVVSHRTLAWNAGLEMCCRLPNAYNIH